MMLSTWIIRPRISQLVWEEIVFTLLVQCRSTGVPVVGGGYEVSCELGIMQDCVTSGLCH
jgi:hypothetical protein